jgi:hypothetical protein
MTQPLNQKTATSADRGEYTRSLADRIKTVQDKAAAIGVATTITEAELKSFMDEQWGEVDQSSDS